jgi:formate dehydrogenase subunit gamma
MTPPNDDVVRFGLRERIEHLLVMVSFFVLAATGLPQKFHTSALAKAIVDGLGGIAQVRHLHRLAGALFTLLTLVHLATVLARVLGGRSSLAMVPRAKDFRDVVTTLRYQLRLSEVRAEFDRFDYREKFDYWSIVFGGIVMIATGFALLYPVEVARYLPGQLIPAAREAHGNEGLLALLVVLLWHLYHVVLAPGVFPGNTSIFSGKISRERMRHEHPLEYARRFPEEAAALPAQPGSETAPKPDEG